MPGKCSCAGSTCNCLIVDGIATNIRGTGAIGDPYYVDVDATQLDIGSTIATSDSPTVKFTKTGTGGSGDPVILTAAVRMFSPDGSTWTPSISNTGVLTWAKV